MRPSAQPQTSNFNPNLMRSPEPTGSVRRPSSIDRAQRSVTSNNLELPYVDPQARFSISYVPGMSEHVVNTGKTLPEAQLKVVLLACEVERLNTLNYNLVKENEILKAQSRKTDREADLETKLAIVLAENEKLNQIVEELHAVYARDRENEDNDRKIQELLHDLDEWKERYNALKSQNPNDNSGELRVIIQDLQKEREALKEELGRQGRDMDALRARLNSIQVGPVEVRLLQEQITNLKVENDKYKSELETMHLKYRGNADDVQLRMNQYEAKLRVILAENDKLNNLLVEKARELQELQARNEKLNLELHDAHRTKDLAIQAHGEERAKKAGLVSPSHLDRLSRNHEDSLKANADTVGRLTAENDRLNAMVVELRTDNESLRRVTVQLNGLLDENRKLNDALSERNRENDRLNGLIYELRAENDRLKKGDNQQARLEQLSIQINGLLEENRKLNDSLADRLRENDTLRVRVHDLEVQGTAVNDLRSRLNLANSETERLNGIIVQLRAENDKLRGLNTESLLAENKRLNDLVLERAGETDRLRRAVAEHEANAGALKSLNDRVLFLSQENEKLTLLIVELRDKLAQSGTSTHRVDSLTLQINTLLEENKRLNDGLIVRLKEIDSLRLRITELEGQLGGNRSLENKLALLTSDNERLNASIYELRIENDKLKAELTRNDSSNTRIQQLTVQINSLLDENRRLNDLVVERSSQIDRLKRMMVEQDAANATINDLRSRVNVLSTENERSTKTILELREECDRLRILNADTGRINQLTIQINSLLEENKRLNDLLLNRSAEVDRLKVALLDAQAGSLGVAELRERNSVLTAETQRLGAEIKRLTLELASSSTHVTKIEQLTVQINSLLSENRRLNELVVEKARECDELRRRIPGSDDSAYVIKDLRDKLALLATDSERLNLLVAELRRENDQLKVANSRVESLTVQINSLLDENRRLNDALAVKMREDPSLKDNRIQLEGTNAAISALTADNKRLSGALEEARNRYLAFERENAQTADLRNRIQFLTAENEKLRATLTERTTELDQLRREKLVIQATPSNASGDDYRAKLMLVASENDRLNALVHEKLREIDSLKATITQLQNENQRLRNDNNNLYDENQRLSLSGNRVVVQSPKHEKVVRSALPAAMTESQTKFEAAKQNAIQTLEAKVQFLESEIHRLTTLVHEQEREISGLRSRETQVDGLQRENSRLNQILAEKTREIEILKGQVPQNDLRATLEEEYRRLLNNQIAEITARFGEERLGYDKRHNESLQRLHELQEKIQHLTTEQDKLLAALEQARQELSHQKALYNQLERDKVADAERLRLDYERRVKESPTRKGMSQAVIDLEEKVALLTNEKERLEALLNRAHRDHDDLNKREHVRAQEIEELRQQFENSKKINIEAKEVQVKFNAERTAYETQILQLQQTVADLEGHVKMIASENDRLNKLSIQRLHEVEELKRQLGGEGSATTLEITQLRTQIENYKAGQHDIQQLAIKYSADKAADQSQIKQLKQVCENYKAEIDKLYALLDQRKTDFTSLTQQNQQLLEAYEKLIVETGGKSGSGSGKERIEVLEREVRDLEHSRDEFRQQAQRNSVELTRKTRDLVDRIQDLDILKMKYEEAVANYQALNGRMFERLSVSERR